MSAEHQQYQLTHLIKPSSFLSITTTGYINRFKRNWYKLDDVDLGERIGISNVVSDPGTYASEYTALLGNEDTPADVFGIKANNRKYNSKGIQSTVRAYWGTDWFQSLELGIRYHEDDEDRFQWEDRYAFQDNELVGTTVGEKGAEGNRIAFSKAWATYFLYKLSFDNLTLTPGLRYENIELGRLDYGGNDPNRLGADLSKRANIVNVWIPGMGANYNFSNDWSIFGGVHKGFSPPGSQEGQDPEESVNYELGSRFNYKGLQGVTRGSNRFL